MKGKNAKKRNPSKSKKKKIIFLSVFVLLSVSILLGLSVTVWFPVKNVQLSGSEIYEDIELVNALDINEKENLLLLKEDALLNKLQKDFPYINELKLKKKLPNTAVITVSDVKSFYSFLKGEEVIITDKTLRVLEGEIKTSVTPTEIDCEWQRKGQYVELNVKNYLDTVNYLSNEFSAAGITFNKATFTDIGDVNVKLDGRFEVELGDIEKIEEKLPRLFAMIKEIAPEKQGRIKLSEWTNENRKSYFVEEAVS